MLESNFLCYCIAESPRELLEEVDKLKARQLGRHLILWVWALENWRT